MRSVLAVATVVASVVAGVRAQRQWLPLLPAGPQVGIEYGVSANQNATDRGFVELVKAGASNIAVIYNWDDIEPNKGQVDFSGFQQEIAGFASLGIKPYVVVSAMNAFGATVPADLADPSNNNLLAPGLNWNDSTVANRFLSIVAQAAEIASASGMFYFGVGQEVERFLASQPQYQFAFIELAAASGVVARNYSGLTDLAVGVSFNFDGLAELHGQPFINEFFATMDQTPIVYVPIYSNWTVRSPASPGQDLPALLQYLPSGWPIVLERVGYPSGFQGVPSACNSSQVLQFAFWNIFFDIASSAGGEQVFRYIGVDELVDVDPTFCQDLIKAAGQAVAEVFCTKGLLTFDGTDKLAKSAAVNGVDEYTTPASTSR